MLNKDKYIKTERTSAG